MPIKIRPGDLEADRDTAVALLRRYVNPAYDAARFDWLYCANPAGRGRLWMAEDGATGTLVGTAGALPRRLSVDGQDCGAWVLADFCISDTHRALGPALQLQRACLEDLAADGVALCYDFPSRTMEAVYRRLGLAARMAIRRLSRPLRVYPMLRERLSSRALARALSPMADAVLGWGLGPAGPLSVALHEGACGEEFTALADSVGSRGGVCGRRSAEYLAWRYRDNPIRRHDILAVRLRGDLVGYVVLAGESDTAHIVDLFAEPDPALVRRLARSALAWIRRRGYARASLWLRDSHPWTRLLAEEGFRLRETSPVLLHAPARSALTARLLDTSAWLLTTGDRDS